MNPFSRKYQHLSLSMISIIIPTYNEEKYISSCLDSVLEQDYPKDRMEIFIVDGRSSDQTSNIVQKYCKEYSFIQLIDNPQQIVPTAMNKAIIESKGDYIIRLDAHSTFPKNYMTLLIKNALEYNSDNIGGICITEVKNKTKKSLAIKEVLGHRFGVGNSLFRTGTSEPTETDTVPFGCFKRDVFSRFGNYDERLVRNQDIELNKRIGNGGGKIILVPEIKCIYYARETYMKLLKNNYENGLWNMLTVFYTRSFKSLSLRHFIPFLFICSLIIPTIISVIYRPFILLSFFSFAFYISFLITINIQLSIKTKQNFYYLLVSFITLHFSYGYGSFIGFFKTIIIRAKE